jgi:Na+/citrate or Na+/malate symporter
VGGITDHERQTVVFANPFPDFLDAGTQSCHTAGILAVAGKDEVFIVWANVAVDITDVDNCERFFPIARIIIIIVVVAVAVAGNGLLSKTCHRQRQYQ